MFEKEAEERGNEKIKGNYDLARCSRKSYKDGFKEGAEFGYNKANEWHKVLDGDFPKHNNEVLCLLWGGTKEIGCYKNGLWYFEDFTADKDDVDYWQEIILPKEEE
jgi:hypothetical protein